MKRHKGFLFAAAQFCNSWWLSNRSGVLGPLGAKEAQAIALLVLTAARVTVYDLVATSGSR